MIAMIFALCTSWGYKSLRQNEYFFEYSLLLRQNVLAKLGNKYKMLDLMIELKDVFSLHSFSLPILICNSAFIVNL